MPRGNDIPGWQPQVVIDAKSFVEELPSLVKLLGPREWRQQLRQSDPVSTGPQILNAELESFWFEGESYLHIRYIYIYIYIYLNMYVYICYMCIQICIYTCVSVYIYIYTDTHISIISSITFYQRQSLYCWPIIDQQWMSENDLISVESFQFSYPRVI